MVIVLRETCFAHSSFIRNKNLAREPNDGRLLALEDLDGRARELEALTMRTLKRRDGLAARVRNVVKG